MLSLNTYTKSKYNTKNGTCKQYLAKNLRFLRIYLQSKSISGKSPCKKQIRQPYGIA